MNSLETSLTLGKLSSNSFWIFFQHFDQKDFDSILSSQGLKSLESVKGRMYSVLFFQLNYTNGFKLDELQAREKVVATILGVFKNQYEVYRNKNGTCLIALSRSDWKPSETKLAIDDDDSLGITSYHTSIGDDISLFNHHNRFGSKHVFAESLIQKTNMCQTQTYLQNSYYRLFGFHER
jgi:hypothetical protein